jgi:hypothetical protein
VPIFQIRLQIIDDDKPGKQARIKITSKATTQRTLTESRNMMKRFNPIVLATAAACAFAMSGHANVLVNETWLDSLVTDPASPAYAENNGVTGTDADSDGNLESAMFRVGSGNTLTATPGNMSLAGITSSAGIASYFTPQATPVSLANVGDAISLTWVFTPKGTLTANTSQGFNIAIAQTPSSATRLTANGTPPNALYSGYSVFNNMNTTFNHATPFQLKEWTATAAGSLLGTAGNWTALANGAASGNTGFAVDTAYTFLITLTRAAGNGMDITTSITGGTINGTGSETITYSDTTANTFTFDTFFVRQNASTQGVTQFDTSLFKVEFIPVPEPATFALAGLGVLGLVFARRIRR